MKVVGNLPVPQRIGKRGAPAVAQWQSVQLLVRTRNVAQPICISGHQQQASLCRFHNGTRRHLAQKILQLASIASLKVQGREEHHETDEVAELDETRNLCCPVLRHLGPPNDCAFANSEINFLLNDNGTIRGC
jgi:hypothetical protein